MAEDGPAAPSDDLVTPQPRPSTAPAAASGTASKQEKIEKWLERANDMEVRSEETKKNWPRTNKCGKLCSSSCPCLHLFLRALCAASFVL